MKKIVVARLFAFLIGLAAGGLVLADELAERAVVKTAASEAYGKGDFEELERQHARYEDFLNQRTSSGAFKIFLFFDGIEEVKTKSKEKWLLDDIERTRGWVDSHPNSPVAYVFHAMALQSYGQYFRGVGYSNSVPPQAQAVYRDYYARAANYLVENEAKASSSTSWHAWMLNVARVNNWSPAAVMKIFESGVKQQPNDYRLYVNALNYFLPKWFGNVKTVDAIIALSVQRAPAYGLELYARMYSDAGEDQFERALYTESLVDWPTMKEGLDLWVKRFPTDWNKNIEAYHACIAGDKPLAQALLKEIDGSPEWEIWRPQAQVTFDTCSRWAADPAAEPLAPRPRLSEKLKVGA